ncbi:class I SAM-dependent methyltransferase [Streptomyces sp. ADMS]|uniref:class I SAM-dependent methyltransferase n=1 Tax=Streptomyces sp. ADMS TaxID=3071415 RepID=UPI00296E33CD|nr:class I SAM-dependent methyltransferase [Streptomyces sp. ADMS]MDW4909849.1 class I SAM-dependent methyltransferase [Streptomyces sp. ADMS]
MITTVQRPTPADWDSWYTAGWPAVVTDKESESFHRTVQPYPGMTAVDLACGNGQWMRQLTAWGVFVTGYDFSTEALRQARAAGLPDGLSYAQWDIDAEPIPPALMPGSLDLVTCRHALPYLEYARVLTDVGRWLKPSGIFYALVRVADDQDNATAQSDSVLESFHRGFTEAQIDGIGIGWARRTTYRLSARNCGIVLRGYGDSDCQPCDVSS